MRLSFLVPGELDTPTGGYAYARHVLAGLRAAGHEVDLRALAGNYPQPDPSARSRARELLDSLPCGELTLVDGLALGVLADEVASHGTRLRLVALVHHPLFLESGLNPARQRELFESERAALAHCRCIITTSAATARGLGGCFGIEAGRIHVAEPGTDPRPVAGPMSISHNPASARAAVQLLCVGAVVPRKGHRVLIEALHGLRHLAWRLTCIGALDRDETHARQMQALAVELSLADRIDWCGAVDEPVLAEAWAASDVFVLASEHEGYGMAYAEALRAGLPVVGTTAAAVPELLDAGARLVEPGNVLALREALSALLVDGGSRAALAQRARAAGQHLPRWSDTVRSLVEALERVT